MYVSVKIDPKEFALDLTRELSFDKIIQLVIDIDDAAQCWNVTKPLCDHFAKLAEQYED